MRDTSEISLAVELLGRRASMPILIAPTGNQQRGHPDGELATALRSGTDEELALEMADVLAWLVTLASIRGIDLEAAATRKYGIACPGGCGNVPCGCDPAEKP